MNLSHSVLAFRCPAAYHYDCNAKKMYIKKGTHMIGLGTLVNTAAVLAGGGLGLALKHGLRPQLQKTIMQAMGMATIFIGVAGTLQQMLQVTDTGLEVSGTMLMILSLILGGVVGALLQIERRGLPGQTDDRDADCGDAAAVFGASSQGPCGVALLQYFLRGLCLDCDGLDAVFQRSDAARDQNRAKCHHVGRHHCGVWTGAGCCARPSICTEAGLYWMTMPLGPKATTPSVMCKNKVESLSRSLSTSESVFCNT